MGPVEITIIVIAVAIVVAFIVTYIVRKAKGKPTGECACCPYAKECGGQSKNSCGCHSQSIDLSQYIRNDNSENDNKKDNSENNDNKNN